MNETAVEWLAEKYNYITWMRNRDEMSPETADKLRQDFFEQAKQMEKDQIIKSNRDGVDMVVNKQPFITGEEYYKETYEKNNN